MSIFDLFSSDSGTSAARKSYRDVVQGLESGYSGAKKDLTTGLRDVTGTLTNYGNQAINALMGGTQQAEGAIQQGLQPFQQLFGQFEPAVSEYFGLLGSGTPQQIQQAQQAWQSSPFNQALQTDIGTGEQALARQGFGVGQTGQTSQDVMNFISNLTQKSLGNFENLLSPAIGGAESAAQGIQGGFTNLAKLMEGGGAGVADILRGMGSGIAGAQGTTYADLANLVNQAKQGIGQAGATEQQQIYGAQQGAAANTLNALFGGLGLLTSPFASTSLLGGISNLFGGSGGGSGSGFNTLLSGDYLAPSQDPGLTGY